jgi:hypothetical protein
VRWEAGGGSPERALGAGNWCARLHPDRPSGPERLEHDMGGGWPRLLSGAVDQGARNRFQFYAGYLDTIPRPGTSLQHMFRTLTCYSATGSSHGRQKGLGFS